MSVSPIVLEPLLPLGVFVVLWLSLGRTGQGLAAVHMLFARIRWTGVAVGGALLCSLVEPRGPYEYGVGALRLVALGLLSTVSSLEAGSLAGCLFSSSLFISSAALTGLSLGKTVGAFLLKEKPAEEGSDV